MGKCKRLGSHGSLSLEEWLGVEVTGIAAPQQLCISMELTPRYDVEGGGLPSNRDNNRLMGMCHLMWLHSTQNKINSLPHKHCKSCNTTFQGEGEYSLISA